MTLSKRPPGILRTTHCARSTIARRRLHGARPVIPSQRDGKHPRAADSHAPARSRAQDGFEKSEMALAFSTGSAQAGAMSAPLRPRPARALHWNFRRFESASTKKDRESRAIELRTPPSMSQQARP